MSMVSMRAALGQIELENGPDFLPKKFEAVKIANIRLFGDARRPTTAVAYHGFSDMVHNRPLMKSFAGFLLLLVVRELHEGSWRSMASFFLPIVTARGDDLGT